MSLIIVATITPAEGKLDAVVDVFREIIPQVHEEAGCELYALHRHGDDLVMIEKWTSAELQRVHDEGPVVQDLLAKLDGLTSGDIEVLKMSAIPAGTPEAGAL